MDDVSGVEEMKYMVGDTLWWRGKKWFYVCRVGGGGIKICDNDKNWINVVCNNTKPVIRCYAELNK